MNLKYTPLYPLHEELGARLVPFAGYAMPVSYPPGIKQEHLHTREAAGLFDVSHMGQVMISGAGATRALEALMPVDLEVLDSGRQSYALFTNEQGGVIDDLMITRLDEESYLLVINAACKEKDLAHLQGSLPGLDVKHLSQQALLALQGPAAKTVMAVYMSDLDKLGFMHSRQAEIEGISCTVNRAGYTGEDGFEISVADSDAERLARLLLSFDSVEAVGLGARDSLRLEAGLCLYGHELNEDISPIEAGLNWSISRSRRIGGTKEGGFPGATNILTAMQEGVETRLVGLSVEGRIPAREGTSLYNVDGEAVGVVSSGGYAPTVSAPIAMAFVGSAYTETGTELEAIVRNKSLPVRVTRLPFVPHSYYRI